MKPLSIVVLVTSVLGVIFVAVSLLSWPRVSILEISQGANAAGNILGLTVGSALISLAITAWLLGLHAKEVGIRTLQALNEHAYEERERVRREEKPLSFRS